MTSSSRFGQYRQDERRCALADAGHALPVCSPSKLRWPLNSGHAPRPAVRSDSQEYGLSDEKSGVVVEGVGQGTDAKDKGPQAGDVIVKAGSLPVRSANDVLTAVAEARQSKRSGPSPGQSQRSFELRAGQCERRHWLIKRPRPGPPDQS